MNLSPLTPDLLDVILSFYSERPIAPAEIALDVLTVVYCCDLCPDEVDVSVRSWSTCDPIFVTGLCPLQFIVLFVQSLSLFVQAHLEARIRYLLSETSLPSLIWYHFLKSILNQKPEAVFLPF